MLIGRPTPLKCCAASWAIRPTQESRVFRLEKPGSLLATEPDGGPQQAIDPGLPPVAGRAQCSDHVIVEPQGYLGLVLATWSAATTRDRFNDVRDGLACGSGRAQFCRCQRRVVGAG